MPDNLTMETVISGNYSPGPEGVSQIKNQEIVAFLISSLVSSIKLIIPKRPEDLSSLERQVVGHINSVNQRKTGFDVDACIRAIYHHFNLSVPERYRAPKNPVSQSAEKPANLPSNGKENGRTYFTGDILKKPKPNRRKKGKRRFMPKSGHSLKSIIVPTIGKKASKP